KPFAGFAKFESIHFHRNRGCTNRILNLTQLVPHKPELRQQIPGKKATPPDVNCRIFGSGAGWIIAMVEKSCVVQDHAGDRELPVSLAECGNHRIPSMRGQQIHHRRGGLHRVIKIMKGSVTWKKSGISSMKEIKRENNQSLRQVSGAFPENVS